MEDKVFLRNVIMYEQGRSLCTGSVSPSAISAIELVRQFRQLRALVIGDAMLDTYLEGTAARLCSEGPVPVVQKTAEYRIPGGAANTAANLLALDADVLLLARIGRDMAGSILRAVLCERGVSDRWLVEDESVSTLHKLRVLADGQYVVRFDEGGDSDSSFAPQATSSQQRLLNTLEEAYAASDLVIVSDYRYGVVSTALLERLQQLHTVCPKVLVIDSKELQRFSQLQATVVTPNYLEACLLTGQTLTHRMLDLGEVELVGRRLLAMLKTEHVAITLAEHGVLLLNRQGESTHIPAHPVAQANDVGAGDSFASAMALALAAGGSMEEAVQIGIDAASIAVTKRWTSVVQHQELLQRVSVREHVRALSISASGVTEHMIASVIAQVGAERLQRRRIVFTNGVFDILHAGHVQFLRQAKALGDVLIVGINSDSSTRRLKGSRRPINSERDRLALVAALDVVDHVLLFDEDTPTALIRLLRPDIHVKGGDYADEVLPEAEAVREGGGHVVILPLAGSLSTTSMIDRILALTTDGEAPVVEKRNV
jgi:D-beta-D-heptose 7-phosphate kinase/D-beta-D-heptose 1-phosphate adenosyltransferase